MTRSDEQPAELEYLRPGEAARILHISPKTIDRWADQGYLPCLVTLGGHRRFPRAAVLAVAERMGNRPPSPEEPSHPRSRNRARTS